jgi:NAD kinase
MLKEKPYIIHRALGALNGLVENQRFSETKKQTTALNTYKKANSSVMQFFDECIIERPNKNDNGDYKIEDTCTRAKIYKAYLAWSAENMEYKERKSDLFDYIEKLGGDVVVLDGYRYFKKYTLSLETKRKFKIFDSTENVINHGNTMETPLPTDNDAPPE